MIAASTCRGPEGVQVIYSRIYSMLRYGKAYHQLVARCRVADGGSYPGQAAQYSKLEKGDIPGAFLYFKLENIILAKVRTLLSFDAEH